MKCEVCERKTTSIPVNLCDIKLCRKCYRSIRELQDGKLDAQVHFFSKLEKEQRDMLFKIADKDKQHHEQYREDVANSDITFEKLGLHSKRPGWSREPISNFINIDNEGRRVKAMQPVAERKRDELEGING